MDFIPFNSEPENGNNRQRDEHSSGTKKKRPIDDANQVGRLVVLLSCTNLIFQFRRDLKTYCSLDSFHQSICALEVFTLWHCTNQDLLTYLFWCGQCYYLSQMQQFIGDNCGIFTAAHRCTSK